MTVALEETGALYIQKPVRTGVTGAAFVAATSAREVKVAMGRKLLSLCH